MCTVFETSDEKNVADGIFVVRVLTVSSKTGLYVILCGSIFFKKN